MLGFSFERWLLLFYIYCVVGWIWETLYVSARWHKWTNRGFLHGPVIPIYGFGAIIVLLVTLRVADNYVLTYLYGMVGATVLEYVTGTVMEAIFKVRYWDYSQYKINLNGHICLIVSLGWGLFSLVMVNYLNTPFASFVASLDEWAVSISVFAITIGFSVDTVLSVREALDLRELMEKVYENNAKLQAISARLDDASNVINSEMEDISNVLKSGREQFRNAMEAQNAKLERLLFELATTKVEPKKYVADKVNALNELRISKLEALHQELESYSEEFKRASVKPTEVVKLELDVDAFKKEIKDEIHNLFFFDPKQYLGSMRIIKRNPSATSKQYQEALDWLMASMKDDVKKGDEK